MDVYRLRRPEQSPDEPADVVWLRFTDDERGALRILINFYNARDRFRAARPEGDERRKQRIRSAFSTVLHNWATDPGRDLAICGPDVTHILEVVEAGAASAAKVPDSLREPRAHEIDATELKALHMAYSNVVELSTPVTA